MFLLLPLAISLPPQAEDIHIRINPVYRSLVKNGVFLSGKLKAPVPKAMVPDTDIAKQTAALKKYLGKKFTLDRFLRRSLTAPRVCLIGDVRVPGSEAPVYRVDVAFVVYADLKQLDNPKLIDEIAGQATGRKQQFLSAQELAKRNLRAQSTADVSEHYIFESGFLLNRIQLALTSRVVLSRAKNSIVIAKAVDRRFNKDREYPNYWQSLTRKDGKMTQTGPKHSFSAVAAYAKITRLVQPKGALSVEFHMVYAEPKGWFGGANLFRSRLPLMTHLGAVGLRAKLRGK